MTEIYANRVEVRRDDSGDIEQIITVVKAGDARTIITARTTTIIKLGAGGELLRADTFVDSVDVSETNKL